MGPGADPGSQEWCRDSKLSSQGSSEGKDHSAWCPWSPLEFPDTPDTHRATRENERNIYPTSKKLPSRSQLTTERVWLRLESACRLGSQDHLQVRQSSRRMSEEFSGRLRKTGLRCGGMGWGEGWGEGFDLRRRSMQHLEEVIYSFFYILS